MSGNLIIKNGTVVVDHTAMLLDIAIQNGKIARIEI